MNIRPPSILAAMLVSLLSASTFAQVPGIVFNIKDYGAKGDSVTLDTRAINLAVAACTAHGGGTVYVPSGTFVTGTIRLFSNVNLYLSPGSVLLASANTSDFLEQETYGFTGYGAGNKLGIVFADHADNVSITGPGVIDGRPDASLYMDSVQQEGPDDALYTRQGKNYMTRREDREEAPLMWKGNYADRPGPEIVLYACTRVRLNDFCIRNAADWSIAILACDDAKVRGISIKNNLSVPNSDGVDFYDCHNAIVSDCDIRAGDDAIAVISTNNLTVTNCTLTSRSSGIRIGYNAFNHRNSGNLLFDNIRIYSSNRGIGIFQRQQGDMENMTFSNMIIDTRLFPGEWWGHGEPIHISAVPGLGSKSVGRISHVYFSNIIARGEEGILLYGSDSSRLRDIRFDKVRLTVAAGPLTPTHGGNFDLRPANSPGASLFRHDIPGIYAENVDGLWLKDVSMQWAGTEPGYFTSALHCRNFTHLVIDGFEGVGWPGTGRPSILLEQGRGVRAQNLRIGGRMDEQLVHIDVTEFLME